MAGPTATLSLRYEKFIFPDCNCTLSPGTGHYEGPGLSPRQPRNPVGVTMITAGGRHGVPMYCRLLDVRAHIANATSSLGQLWVWTACSSFSIAQQCSPLEPNQPRLKSNAATRRMTSMLPTFSRQSRSVTSGKQWKQPQITLCPGEGLAVR